MADRALRRFCWLYPLANAGGFVAFMPLLNLIVPLRATELAAPGKIALLSETLIFGVLTATVANIVAGVASDWSRARWGTRLPWLWLGLAGSWLSYGAILIAATPTALIVGLIAFQACFNIFYGPLTALFADKVPDGRKARVSAFANLAMPAGSLATALIGLPAFTDNGQRIAVLIALTAVLILPLLLAWPRTLADVPAQPPIVHDAVQPGWAIFWSLWLAKFLVQLSGTVLPSYFLFYLQDGLTADTHGAPIEFAIVVIAATALTAVVAVTAARWSDRTGRRKPFLIGAIAIMAAGLVALILRLGWPTALIGYTLFCAGLGTFLAIDVALVAQILPDPHRRGRDLGVMNAANTLPAVIGPIVAIAVLGESGARFPALFAVLLAGLGASAVALAGNRTLR
ncbi:MFS transporter [Sphingomonas sp. MMS24-J13]|uniref:MFS transporter n=1 Tax=Sphingomonas sp. MMS24-J13 TaxID=3238686 RepID=UPI00384BD6D0